MWRETRKATHISKVRFPRSSLAQGRDPTLGQKVHLPRHKGCRQRRIKGGPPARALAGLDGDSASADRGQILADPPEKTVRSSATWRRSVSPAPDSDAHPGPLSQERSKARAAAGAQAPPPHAVPRGQSQGRAPFPPAGARRPGDQGGSAGAAFPLAEAAPPKQSPTVRRPRTPRRPCPSSPPSPTPASPAHYRGACTFLGPPTAPVLRSVLHSSSGRRG